MLWAASWAREKGEKAGAPLRVDLAAVSQEKVLFATAEGYISSVNELNEREVEGRVLVERSLEGNGVSASCEQRTE